ncbi:MAG: hypothetical protein MI724_14355 [Spirochaetales bacterium]|nr:hypothetical protein [Spirochaetales bacterium]
MSHTTENQRGVLAHYIGREQLGVFASWTASGARLGVARVAVGADDTLQLFVEDCLDVEAGQAVTIHLDNRTGVEEYDADLKVYRSSYKGRITRVSPGRMTVEPEHFELIYGVAPAAVWSAPGYEHPPIGETADAILPGDPVPPFDAAPEDAYNRVGVLITSAPVRPHTTLMAFHAMTEDRIFLVTWRSSLKYRLLRRDARCWFAIDNRNTFTFEKHPKFNYTIIETRARRIADDHPRHDEVVRRFLEKSPFEQGFFLHPEAVLLYLEPVKVVHPTLHPAW